MKNGNDIKKKKRTSLAELVRNLKPGEILDLSRDVCAKFYFGNSRYPINTTALVAILLDMDYKELKGNITPLKLEEPGISISQNEIIKDTSFEIKLKDKSFNLIIEFNRNYNDMKKLNSSNEKNLKNAIWTTKYNQLLKTYYYQCRTYGTEIVQNNNYLGTKNVIAINLSTFSVDNKYVDDLEEYLMMNPKNSLKLTDKVKFYNLDIANMSKKWYTDKYQESNKRERNLICLSKLLTTTSIKTARKCIDNLDIGLSEEEEKNEMKGVLDTMFDKNVSDLVTLEEYADYYNKKHEDEIALFQSELLRLEKEDSRKEGLCIGRKEGLSAGRKEGLSIGRKEGIAENQRDMIINLNKQNVSLDVIARASKLSLSKVKSIINKYCKN